ncbi:hypothetical protein [Sphingopyxis sp. GC21]|uniref:hypothetical protein n=1 Tax=Sphingopyxis sp. GC21 TaxID=2933562 RepID=UPI0021E3CE37|nr:hypothetical protein [Sphingopyxis sp. GC21]
MVRHARARLATFLVTVDFFSGGEHYASETYTIDAANWYRAELAALECSGASIYDDPRIPERSRSATARATDRA